MPQPLSTLERPRYGKWQKWFAWRPVKTISGRHVWLKRIMRRSMWWGFVPPQFPVNHFNKIQYETIDKVIERSLLGED